MDYSKLSDFEINKRVGFMSGRIRKGKTDKHYEKICPDYCNNPSNAWPIIVDNNISLCLHSDDKKERFAFNGFFSVNDMAYSCEHKSENPLRAAMIVYLMMQEVSAGC